MQCKKLLSITLVMAISVTTSGVVLAATKRPGNIVSFKGPALKETSAVAPIAPSQKGKAKATTKNTTTTTTTTTTAQSTSSKGIWKSINATTWTFQLPDGSLAKGWHDDFHFNESTGQMDYGWLDLNNARYFLSTKHDGSFGKKLIGWQWIDGYCYYFDASGRLHTDTKKKTPDGHFVDAQGRWIINGNLQQRTDIGYSSQLPSVQQVAPADTKSTLTNKIATDAKTGAKFIVNQLLLDANADVSEEQVSKLLAPYNGKVVTHILSINTYTVEFSDVKTAQELEAIADELRKSTMFTHVHHNEIVTIQ